MTDHVLVLGGGVGGMTAAHELAERGFSVTVVEARSVPGGKARSIPVTGSGTEGREDLPAEHGFRFFPGFYKHVPDTMKRIPFQDQPDGVHGNLRAATEAEIAREHGNEPLLLPVRFPTSTSDIREILHDLTGAHPGLTAGDLLHFAERLLVFLSSCDERRFGEWEEESWWSFTGAADRSPAYQRFLADGLTRTLVAAQAREMSARTGCSILLQLLFDIGVPGRHTDRLLNGPTDDVWITPWFAHLQSLGVEYRVNSRVDRIDLTDGKVSSVTVTGLDGVSTQLTADWYVSAVPVEHMARLVTDEIKVADPCLANLDKLRTRWMNGIVFYLKNDVPVVNGHVIYMDSAWSLTSVSQKQFWDSEMSSYGDGTLGGILSVDISDWLTPGPLTSKPAMDCTADEVFQETWGQLKAHLNRDGTELLSDDNLIRWFLDDDVCFPDVNAAHGIRQDVNLEPLLVNTVGSWAWRPEAATAIENLLLASDYVRTYTDLATMEGANEAARRAVNCILERSGSSAAPCEIWPLHEPAIYTPGKKIDEWRYHRGHEHEIPAELAT